MAQIPVITEPTVKPEGLRPQYRSADTPQGAFGEGYAQAGQQTAAALTQFSDVLARQRKEADVARVNADTAEFNRQSGLITDAAYQKHGKDAIGVTDATTAQLEELAKTTAKGFANDNQRNLFVPHAMNSITNDRAALSRHEGKEGDDSAVGAAAARMASASERAAKNWTQPEIVEASVRESEQAVRSQATARGWSDEATTQAVSDAKSGIYASILRAQDSQGAHAAFIKTFEAHQGDLNAKDLDTFSKIYQTTTDTAKVFKATDDIYNKHTTLDVHGRLVSQNISAMFTEANEAPPDIRKDVVDEVNRRVVQTQKADDDYRVNVTQSAWDAFEAGGSSISAIPMSVRTELSRVNGAVLEQMKTDERQRIAGGPEPYDFAAYGAYEAQLPADRLKPGNTAMDRLLGRVPRHVLKEKLDEETVTRDQQVGLRTSGAQIRGPSLDRIGIAGVTAQAIQENAELFDTPETMAERNTLKGKFSVYVRQEADSFQKKNKRNPDYDEMRSIIDKALIEGNRPRKYWFDQTVRGFEAKPGDVFPGSPTAEPPAVPDDERAKIVDFMTRKNLPITEEAIASWWARKQAKTAAAP